MLICSANRRARRARSGRPSACFRMLSFDGGLWNPGVCVFSNTGFSFQSIASRRGGVGTGDEVLPRARAAQLARGGERQAVPARHQHDPAVDAGRLLHHLADAAGQLGPLRPALGMALHQQADFPPLLLLDGEGAGIAAAQVRQRLDRPFDVLRPDVAAVDDDQVLGPAGDDQLAVAPVAEVAGVEPAIDQHGGTGLGPAEISGHDARPLDEQPADAALAGNDAVAIADLDAMAGQHAAAHREAALALAVQSPAAETAAEAQADAE